VSPPSCALSTWLGNTTQALLEGRAGFADPTPVFVVGMPRSGSTLVEQIVASHSQAFGAGAHAPGRAPAAPGAGRVVSGVPAARPLRCPARMQRCWLPLPPQAPALHV